MSRRTWVMVRDELAVCAYLFGGLFLLGAVIGGGIAWLLSKEDS